MKDVYLGRGVYYRQDAMPFTTDSALLSWFASPAGGNVCDLGCGGGAVMITLGMRCPEVSLTGIDIRTAAVELCRANIARTGFENRAAAVRGDVRRTDTLPPAGSFDLAVSNPPYIRIGEGNPPKNNGVASARMETCAEIGDFCRAAAYLLKPGGRFCVVFPAGREWELSRAMIENDMYIRRKMRFTGKNEKAVLVFIEGMTGEPGSCEEMAPLSAGSRIFLDITGVFK